MILNRNLSQAVRHPISFVAGGAGRGTVGMESKSRSAAEAGHSTNGLFFSNRSVYNQPVIKTGKIPQGTVPSQGLRISLGCEILGIQVMLTLFKHGKKEYMLLGPCIASIPVNMVINPPCKL